LVQSSQRDAGDNE